MTPAAVLPEHAEVKQDDCTLTPDSNSPGAELEDSAAVATTEEDTRALVTDALVLVPMRKAHRHTIGAMYTSTVQRQGSGRGGSPMRGARDLARRLRSNSGLGAATPALIIEDATPAADTEGEATPPTSPSAVADDDGGAPSAEAPEVLRARARAVRAREAAERAVARRRAEVEAAAARAARDEAPQTRRRLQSKQKAPPAYSSRAPEEAPIAAAAAAQDSEAGAKTAACSSATPRSGVKRAAEAPAADDLSTQKLRRATADVAAAAGGEGPPPHAGKAATGRAGRGAAR